MDIEQSDVLNKTDTTYQSFSVKIGKSTVWSITYSHGRYNEVMVRKVSPNPFRTPGANFDTFEDAVNNYKSSNMKQALRETKSMFEVNNNVVVR